MGIETALIAAGMSAGTASTIATGLSVVSGISSVVGGLQGLQAGKAQGEAAKAQAAIAGQEQARVSAKEAQFERDAMNDTVRRQKLAYMASGVTLEGTPFLALQETKRRGEQNIDEIIRSGASGVAARATEGRLMAKQARSSGRREFIGGITNAVNTFSRMGE
jgi:hypothetical protein